MEVNFNLKTFNNISQSELKAILSEDFYTNIIFIEKGSLLYLFGNAEYNLNEDQVVILPPHTKFSLHSAQKSNLAVSVFSYFIHSDKVPVPRLPVPIIFDSTSPLSQELKKHFLLTENKDYKTAFLKKSMEYKIIYFAENAKDEQEHVISHKMQPLFSYIQKNLSLNFSVRQMAKECNLSEASVYKMFDEYLKIPPKQFIRNQRMKYALPLLLNTKMSISEISYETGFYDQYYFSKEFKKVFSVSPSTYRKNINKT